MSRRSRRGALVVAWRVLTASRRPGAPGLRERLEALPRLVRASLTGRYRGTTRSRLLLLAAALGYLVSPVDLVPEALLGPLGLLDDVGVAAWLAGAVLVETDEFLDWEHRAPRVVAGTVRG